MKKHGAMVGPKALGAVRAGRNDWPLVGLAFGDGRICRWRKPYPRARGPSQSNAWLQEEKTDMPVWGGCTPSGKSPPLCTCPVDR